LRIWTLAVIPLLQEGIVIMLVSYLRYLATPVAAIALLTCCAGGSSTPTTPNALQQNPSRAHPNASCPCLYVTDFSNNSVTVYASGATGNAAPIQTIIGSNTELKQPNSIAVDARGTIYVANQENNSVTVYAAGSTGNVAPIRTISGSNTGLAIPTGVAWDPVTADIYVTNDPGASNPGFVTVYASGASGNVAPIGTIAGANTGIGYPQQIASDASGNIYVSNGTPTNDVIAFAAGTTGNTAPVRTIAGRRTKLDGPHQLVLDSSSNLYVVNIVSNSVTVYASGANGDQPPIQYVKGSSTKLSGPVGIAVDGTRNIYVSHFTRPGGAVNVYAAGATGNVAPTNKIAGSNTGLEDPLSIAIR
jgi:6-phosphogluconolactonase (cycloisomerase 2 family)